MIAQSVALAHIQQIMVREVRQLQLLQQVMNLFYLLLFFFWVISFLRFDVYLIIFYYYHFFATHAGGSAARYYNYSCDLVRGRYKKCLRANLFRTAEVHIAFTRRGNQNDGIVCDGLNIQVCLFFKDENKMYEFQSSLLYNLAMLSGTKRPLRSDNENPDETAINILIQNENLVTVNADPDWVLQRVFRYDCIQQPTTGGQFNCDPCDTFSDAHSMSIFSAEFANITEAEIRVQMLENYNHDFFRDKYPEVAHIKGKAFSSANERKDPNNKLYLSRFIHEHFHGINSIPKRFPSFKLHYVRHDLNKVDCPLFGTDSVVMNPLIKRHRTIVHVIFHSERRRDYLLKYFRDGLVRVDGENLTYELELYFEDATVTKGYLDWKENQTQQRWSELDDFC